MIETKWGFNGRSFSATDRYSLSDDKKTITVAKAASIDGASLSVKETFVKH